MTQLHTNSTPIAESPSAAPASAPAASQDATLTERGQEKARVPWYVAVLCRVGIHRGHWAYVAEGSCTQGRECERCGSVHVRTTHQREWRYIRERTCAQVRSCKRCNAANGERTSHEWSESWEVGTRWWQSGKEAHRCLRCGVVEEWTVNDGD